MNWVDSMTEEQAEVLATALNESKLEVAKVHCLRGSGAYLVKVALVDGRTIYIYTGEVNESKLEVAKVHCLRGSGAYLVKVALVDGRTIYIYTGEVQE